MSKQGEQFLHKQDPSLHTSDPVEHEQQRRQLATEHQEQQDTIASVVTPSVDLIGAPRVYGYQIALVAA